MPEKSRRTFLKDAVNTGIAASNANVISVAAGDVVASGDTSNRDTSSTNGSRYGLHVARFVHSKDNVRELTDSDDHSWIHWNSYRHDAISIHFSDKSTSAVPDKIQYIPVPVLEDADSQLADHLRSLSPLDTVPEEYTDGNDWVPPEGRLAYLEDVTGKNRETLQEDVATLADVLNRTYHNSDTYQSEPTDADKRYMYGFGSDNMRDGKEEWRVHDTDSVLDLASRYHTFDHFDLWVNGNTYHFQFHREDTGPLDVLPDKEFYQPVDEAWGHINPEELNREEQVLYDLATAYGEPP